MRPSWRGAVLLAAMVASHAGWPVAARAQIDSREGIALQNQILELRRDMQTLQTQAARGGLGGTVGSTGGGSTYLGGGRTVPPPATSGSSDLTAQLLARVQALEEQVRQLRGQVDEVANRSDRQSADTAKQIGDLNFSLQQGGQGSRPATAGSAPTVAAGPPPTNLRPVSPSAPQAVTPPSAAAPVAPASPSPPAGGALVRRTPEIALQDGHAALARRDYPAAEAAAREVLQGSRTSPRAYDAQFLLAQALSGQRNYAQAAIAYDDTYTRSHTGSHGADALVGLAGSLAAIGEKRAACETITKLNTEFPRQGGDVRDAASAVRQRAGCR